MRTARTKHHKYLGRNRLLSSPNLKIEPYYAPRSREIAPCSRGRGKLNSEYIIVDYVLRTCRGPQVASPVDEPSAHGASASMSNDEAPSHGAWRAQSAMRHSRPSGRRATVPGGTDIYDARTTRTERVWVPGDTPWPMRYLAVISRPLCFDRDLGRSPHTYRSILRRYPRARARRVRHALH